MTPRRFAVKAWSDLCWTLSIKRCTLWRLVTIVVTVVSTWVALLIIDSNDVIDKVITQLLSPGETTNYAPLVKVKDRIHPKSLTQPVQAAALPTAIIKDYIDQSDKTSQYFKDIQPAVVVDTPMNNRNINSKLENHHVAVNRADNLYQSINRVENPSRSVLFFVHKDRNSPQAIRIIQFLAEQRIDIKITSLGKGIPTLYQADGKTPRYSLLVFEDYVSYLSMDKARWNTLNEYCFNHFIGVLAFTHSSRATEMELFSNMGLKLQHRMKLHHMKLAAERPIWRIAKPQMVFQEPLPSADWTIFIASHETYKPLAYSTVASDWLGSSNDVSKAEFGCVVALHDVGLRDGVHRIILGHDVDFWLNDVIAMDAMDFLSGGKLALPLERLLQVDVDDMFVGKVGIRTRVKDAEAMLSSQQRIAQMVPGFRYTLGFSGGMFLDGDDQEDLGEKRIVVPTETKNNTNNKKKKMDN